jgi:hypothetical protein
MRLLPAMRRAVPAVWVIAIALAVSHLRFLAGGEPPPGFWKFAAALLICYSLPFLLLWTMRLPAAASWQSLLTLALFVFIFAANLLIPSRRFLPGYRPAALEGLAYFFLPLFECALIGLVLLIRAAAKKIQLPRLAQPTTHPQWRR